MPRDYDTELILAAIAGSGGVVKTIAEKIGVHRVTIWKWRNENEEIAKAFDEELESTIDLAESKLIELMKSPDHAASGPAVRFFLGTKGKARGYTKKVEMDGNLNHSGQVQVYLPDNGRGAIGGS